MKQGSLFWGALHAGLIFSQFYGAPTAIRLLLRYDSDFVRRYDRSSLRTLASVGEPINHEAWHWFNDVVGDGRWVMDMVGGCLDLEIMQHLWFTTMFTKCKIPNR